MWMSGLHYLVGWEWSFTSLYFLVGGWGCRLHYLVGWEWNVTNLYFLVGGQGEGVQATLFVWLGVERY